MAPTYKIYPNTQFVSSSTTVLTNSSIGTATTACNGNDDCIGFKFDEISSQGTLYLGKVNFAQPKPIKGVDSYIKGSNSNYWYLWVLIVGIFIIFAWNRCKKE
jgi:hypothetical protein